MLFQKYPLWWTTNCGTFRWKLPSKWKLSELPGTSYPECHLLLQRRILTWKAFYPPLLWGSISPPTIVSEHIHTDDSALKAPSGKTIYHPHLVGTAKVELRPSGSTSVVVEVKISTAGQTSQSKQTHKLFASGHQPAAVETWEWISKVNILLLIPSMSWGCDAMRWWWSSVR